MIRINHRVATIFAILFICHSGTLFAQRTRERTTGNTCNATSGLNGVYRIDTEESDKLYSVIEGATSKVPYSEQQQFFMDLAVRLTPPDLLAIECRGSRISLGSSRAPRVMPSGVHWINKFDSCPLQQIYGAELSAKLVARLNNEKTSLNGSSFHY
jgi:hypothetical protein